MKDTDGLVVYCKYIVDNYPVVDVCVYGRTQCLSDTAPSVRLGSSVVLEVRRVREREFFRLVLRSLILTVISRCRIWVRLNISILLESV